MMREISAQVLTMSAQNSEETLTVCAICFFFICVQNVTEYHAAIDGARQKLTERSERLSLVDRDLVQRADDHAAELDRQANELEE